MNHLLRRTSLTCLLCASTSVVWAESSEWTTFRGADRSATASDTGLLDSWSEKGPPLVWDAAGAGLGYAEISIADGKFYTLGDSPSTASDEDEYLSCFDLKSGKPLWKTKTGEAWRGGGPMDWQGSRSTPSVDGNMVYVITPKGKLFCCQTSDGKVAWSKDLKAEFGGDKADGWGYSESPLVDGDLVICTPGKQDATMVALNKKTGAVEWKCSRANDRGAGHASVVISKVGGTKVYVTTTGSGGMGVDAKSGKLLWEYPFDETTAVIPTPIVRDDLAFLVAGYGRGGALVRQVAKGNSVTIEEIYGLNSELANKHGGVVLVGDYLYGDSDDKGILYCAELMTGKIVWKSRGPGSGSIAMAAADGHLYARYQDGVMALVQANPLEFKLAGSFTPPHVERKSWAHPVIHDGKLYLREDDHVMCYNISK